MVTTKFENFIKEINTTFEIDTPLKKDNVHFLELSLDYFIWGFVHAIATILAFILSIVCLIVTIPYGIIRPIKTKIGNKKRKRHIKDCIETYQRELDNLNPLYFRGISKLPTYSEFFRYNNILPTYNLDNTLQCTEGKRRSLGDIYRIVKYYHPRMTLLKLLYGLSELVLNHKIGCSKCGTIHKYVFHTQSLHVNLEDYVEYDCNYTIKGITLKEIFEYVQSENNKEKTNSAKNNF